MQSHSSKPRTTTTSIFFLLPLFLILSHHPNPVLAVTQFRPAALQPHFPVSSIRSLYTVQQELFSWRTHTYLLQILNQSSLNTTALLNTTLPILLFAPTNNAFISFLRTFSNSSLTNTSAPATVATAVRDVWDSYSNSPNFPALEVVLQYHVVVADLDERAIKARRNIPTMAVVKLDVSGFPQVNDRDRSLTAFRLARQIATTNARLVFINNLLLPLSLNLTTSTNPTNSTPSPRPRRPKFSTVPLYAPLTSLSAFLSARTDVSVMTELFHQTEVLSLLSTYARNDTKLHIFMPTNTALLQFLRAVVSEDLLPSVQGFFSNTSDLSAVSRAVGILQVLWNNILNKGAPSLRNIALYHILATTQSYIKLQGLGRQDSLYFGNSLRISDMGVEDGDEDRDNARVIASFATQEGHVSIVDSVLYVSNSSTLKRIIEQREDISPTPSTKPSVSPSQSVPADTVRPTPANGGGEDAVCFPANARVRLITGETKRMDMLQAGDRVESGTPGGSVVFMWSHRVWKTWHTFIELTTESGAKIVLSHRHYVYANGAMAQARSVQPGDVLITSHGKSAVTDKREVREQGLYAPHTMDGDIMVNDVRASCYSGVVHPKLAHALLAPVRGLVWLGGVREPLRGALYGKEGARRRFGNGWGGLMLGVLAGKEMYCVR